MLDARIPCPPGVRRPRTHPLRGRSYNRQMMVSACLGVVAELLQDAHPVWDAPVLDHLPVLEPGNVDHVDADRLPGRRVAELPGAAVGPAGPAPQLSLVTDL